MQNLRQLISFLLIAIVTAISAFETQAQFSGGGFGGGRMSRGDHGSTRPGGTAERSVRETDIGSAEQIYDRLLRLHEDLKLAPGQEAPWQRFADSVLGYTSDLARERALSQGSAKSEVGEDVGLVHIRHVVDAARNRLAALEIIETSVSSLYGALTADQKRLADTRIPSIVAPRPRNRLDADMAVPGGQSGGADNLPDIGGRPSR